MVCPKPANPMSHLPSPQAEIDVTHLVMLVRGQRPDLTVLDGDHTLVEVGCSARSHAGIWPGHGHCA